MLSRANRRSGYRRGRDSGSYRGLVAAVLAAVAIAASGTIVACSDDLAGPQPADQPSATKAGGAASPVTSRNVGAFHNEFLDFAFPNVLAVASSRDQKKICHAIAKAMREFVVLRKIPVTPSSIGDDVAGPACGAQQNANGHARRSLAGDGTPIPELDPFVAEMAVAVAEGRSISDLSAFFDQKIAYARANFPAEEAEVVVATASVALSSAEYWDANYAAQEQQILEQMAVETYSRIEASPPSLSTKAPGAALNSSLLTPPSGRSDNWLTDQPWYPKARRVAGNDVRGAVDGAIRGIFGGWNGIGAGALIGGASASANAAFAMATQ